MKNFHTLVGRCVQQAGKWAADIKQAMQSEIRTRSSWKTLTASKACWSARARALNAPAVMCCRQVENRVEMITKALEDRASEMLQGASRSGGSQTSLSQMLEHEMDRVQQALEHRFSKIEADIETLIQQVALGAHSCFCLCFRLGFCPPFFCSF